MNKKLQEKLFEVSTLFYKHYKSNLFYNKRGITMSSYFRNFSIPSDSVIKNIIIYGDNFRAKLSYFDNNEYYPIGLFSNGVNLEFSPLTILYGNNGSGKSTISNLIAKKMNIGWRTHINSSHFFRFLLKIANFASIQILMMMTKKCDSISSDDV